LSYEAGAGLVTAMIHNQMDTRWHDIWRRYLMDVGHPFLPGKAAMGMRGLLGMPEREAYWWDIAQGVRDVEQRFLMSGRAGVKDEPNVIDELKKIVAVVFDWWNEPAAAQRLLQGSMELMGSEGWSSHALGAWAAEIVRRDGWAEAACAGDDMQKRRFADCMMTGLTWYGDWQEARSVPLDAGIRKFEQESRDRASPRR
jgi:hypothetical protein